MLVQLNIDIPSYNLDTIGRFRGDGIQMIIPGDLSHASWSSGMT
jgi:hypothetical protein